MSHILVFLIFALKIRLFITIFYSHTLVTIIPPCTAITGELGTQNGIVPKDSKSEDISALVCESPNDLKTSTFFLKGKETFR